MSTEGGMDGSRNSRKADGGGAGGGGGPPGGDGGGPGGVDSVAGGGGDGGTAGSDDGGGNQPIALCASCDRCRSRKTKCDGKRPCGNCATKYMKRHKLTSVEGVDLSEFECVYSPAKRRGPVPGKAGQTRKSSEIQVGDSAGAAAAARPENGAWGAQPGSAAAVAAAVASGAWNGHALDGSSAFNQAAPVHTGSGGIPDGANAATALQQQLGLLRQLQQQQAAQAQLQQPGAMDSSGTDEPSAQRLKRDQVDSEGPPVVPKTITSNTHLLERSNAEGSRLYAYYKLSIDEMFRLPTTPTDDDYCAKVPGMTPESIPGTHLAALSAARFAELALGALVHNEISTAMELCNAVVHCLRESVQETSMQDQTTPTFVLYEVSKAYFLLGVFRAFRGDMQRYFKYRRVCMTYLAKLENDKSTSTLMAAVSFLDAWAYMVYNANEKALPSVDDTIPRVSGGSCVPNLGSFDSKFNVRTDPNSIATDPKNQNWIQGAPPVYLNNEAPMHARSLDAIACAVRTCCDQANCRFAEIAKQADAPGIACQIPADSINTPTATIVVAHENELCSRNMVLSAYTLMQQEESSGSQERRKNEGLHMVISAMDAFLENSDDEGQSGFTDSQIQSLLSVCNTVLENPLLLHHAGPTYHMVSNAAILLCHLLNGMHSMKQNGGFGSMEATLFEEVMDTLIPIRKLLTIHRRKLPVKLRCHGIPRPRIDPPTGREPLIDLGETLLCSCRGCQGFVLMACSPCVAAERARAASTRMQVESAQEAEAVELGEIDKELDDLGAQFNLDDDALLGMISNLIQN